MPEGWLPGRKSLDLAGYPGSAGTEADWWRLLDALTLVAAHPAERG
jgi:hypothetical protein